MGSVVSPWQTPREPLLAKRRVLAGGERCHQCSPADTAGQSGQGGPSARAFFLSPVGVSPTQAPDPGLGKAGRESADCPGWAAVSYMAGTTFPLPPRSSPWKPLQLHVKVPGGSAPGAPGRDLPGTPQPRCRCREWGAGPRIDLPRPRPWVGRSSSWGWLCRQEPLGFLFHPDTRAKDGRGVALSWAAANGRLTAANTPLSSPPCWGDRGERMAMRAGRTRGRQVRAQSLSLPSFTIA